MHSLESFTGKPPKSKKEAPSKTRGEEGKARHPRGEGEGVGHHLRNRG